MTQAKGVNVRQIEQHLQSLGNPQDAEQQARFFKTGPGQYGEGDRFLGIRVPVLRKLARQYSALTLEQGLELLSSPLHEQRLLALLILIHLYQQADEPEQGRIYSRYLKHTRYINNWDLVDVSADKIVGHWLYHHPQDRTMLQQLARSHDLWRRRIAVMATFYFIRQSDFRHTLNLAKLLLSDKHDLIHKATGWMLREVGNRDRATEQAFLDKYVSRMPRTMLRYAIEKFPQGLRQKYLKR